MGAHWHRLLIVAVLTVAYATTLASGITFSDGPEIATAIATLGVMHPTGYPIFTVVVNLFNRLLALDVEACVKVEIFNALCGIAAACLTCAATERLIAQINGGRRDWRHASRLAGALAGLLMGLSSHLWGSVRIPEVYAFHALLVSAAGYAWLRYCASAKARYALAGAWLMGMGLSHHVTMVYMLPAAALLLLVRRPRFYLSWQFPAACVLGFIPLLSYGYLIWANAHTTGVPWGGVHDWDTLYAHMTGKQYRSFLGAAQWPAYAARIARLPELLEKQLLATGCALLPVGALVLVRRAWRAWLFVVVYMLLNSAHAILYGVGDYANYYLPAHYGGALLVGVGLWWLVRWALTRRPAARWWLSLTSAAVLLAAAAITVHRYKVLRRVPLSKLGAQAVTIALAAAAVACLVAIVVVRRKATRIRWPRKLLPLVIAGGCIAGMLSVGASRAVMIGRFQLVGESYSSEVVDNIPPGSLLLTQGDGYLFSMWYQHHVLGRGLDFATVDVGNHRNRWYARYLRGRYPLSCDPLNPRIPLDRCKTFADRIALAEKRSWVGENVPYGRVGPKPPVVRHPIVSGNDARCSDETFYKEHRYRECRCYVLGTEVSKDEQLCVFSPEAGGIVVRMDRESLIQRFIEDHIHVRPLFERNVLTFTIGDKKLNYRDWSGPGYQRVSGQYATINRGRFSQIVRRRNVHGIDPCAREQFEALPTPVIRRRRRLHVYARHPYAPNHFPRLLQATYLSPIAKPHEDHASRRFAAGDDIYMHLSWFETVHYDIDAPDRRGAPLRHGVRVCVFDAAGKRIDRRDLLSGKTTRVKLSLPADAPGGRYHVQACSTGDVGNLTDTATLSQRACVRALLEYPFEVALEREH